MSVLSDDPKVYYFLYGDGWEISQREVLDSGYYTIETYKEFDRLQKTVLKDLPYKDDFDGIKFNDEPFISPDKLEVKTEKEKLQYEKDNSETPDKSVNIDKKFCNENKKNVCS